MAGGGSAPAMKMSDVFIVLGVTFLIGGLFMHGLVSPTSLDSDSEPYSNGASLLKGDSIEFTINIENQSALVLEVKDEDGSTVLIESHVLASGDEKVIPFEAEEKGFYTYTVEFSEGSGELLVDVDRKLLLDFLIYPLGIICMVFGMAKRKDEQSKESIDAVLVSSD